MEGVVNLQSEGFIGVVCFGKFNASVERKRLPREWEFVSLVETAEEAQTTKVNGGLTTSSTPSLGNDGAEDEHGHALPQLHETGYWRDELRRRVKGTILFRIRNFDVGLGYLSIEGTMLPDEEERQLVAEEMEVERRRKEKMRNSMLRRPPRRVPEFSMTKFGREDEEENSGHRQELYKGSRPVTPDG